MAFRVSWRRKKGRWVATAKTTLGIKLETGGDAEPLTVEDARRIERMLQEACTFLDVGHQRLCEELQTAIDKRCAEIKAESSDVKGGG